MLRNLLIQLYNILIVKNPLFKNKWISFLTFFLLALAIRLILFSTVWYNLKHGSSGPYGSGAVGLFKEGKFTTTQYEEDHIYDSKNMSKKLALN